MELRADLRSQIESRMELIRDMQVNGVITTPLDYLEVPIYLVSGMATDYLDALLTLTKRTRKKGIVFSLNGRRFIVPRKDAINLVNSEIAFRSIAK